MKKMSREKQLIKNSIVIGIGRLLPKFIAIITLPIITSQLTKAEYGIYDLVSTLVMFLLPIATLQVHSAAFRFLIERRKSEEKITKVISNIIIIVFPISLLVSTALFFIWNSIEPTTRLFICIYLIMDILFLCVSQFARGLSHNKEYSIASIIISVLNAFGIVFSLIINNNGITGIVFWLGISHLVASLFIIYRLKIYKYVNFQYVSKDSIREIIQYSWPMIPNNLSVWVLSLSDRVVITNFLGLEANATYAVANKIPQILSIAQSIFVMAWQENASIAVNDNDATEYYSSMFRRVFKIMFSLTVLLIGMTPIMFKILIRGNYDDAYIQIPILFLAMFFNCMASFMGGIYIAHKKTKRIGISTMIIAAINIIIDLLLVNVIGITAGSISTLVAYLLLYLYRCIDMQKFQKIELSVSMQLKYILIIITMLVLCFFRTTIFNAINIILGLLFFTYGNREYILALWKKYIKKN